MDVAIASLRNPAMGEIDVNRRSTSLDHLNDTDENSPSHEDDLDHAAFPLIALPHHAIEIKTENSPASSPGVSENGLPADGGGNSSRASSMSGDGGGDTGSHTSSIEAGASSTNRRKRKSIPIKRPSSNDPDDDDESAINDNTNRKKLIQDVGTSKKLYQMRWSEVEHDNNSKGSSHVTSVPVSVSISTVEKPPSNGNGNLQKDFATMDEARMRMQLINAQPRKFCPVCGDKANGLHYGIYSCEGCKNFFKRSVLVCQDRPYVCKFGNTCSVSITEVYGVKQKTSRCQACRYQACIDAGMYHSGVQRTRGGRHSYSPAKMSQRNSSTTTTKTQQNLTAAVTSSSSPPSTSVTESAASSKQSNFNQDLGMTSKYPQIQTPDIAATLAAVASRSTSPPVSSKNNLSGSNGYSESQSTRSSQHFSRHLQNPSPRNSITKESHLTIDKSSKNKEKSRSTNNERRNNDNYGHVRELSVAPNQDTVSKEALDFKIFAENLIRKNMSAMTTNNSRDSVEENDPSNITLKSLLSNVNAQEIRFMERFKAENLGSEIEILKAKNRELQLSSTEKDKQLQLYQKQVDILKSTLTKADKINKEQARTIESLKQSLLKEMERYDEPDKREMSSSHGSNIGLTLQKKSYANYISDNGSEHLTEQRYNYKGERRHSKKSPADDGMRGQNFAIYERGGVTITPVSCNSNKSSPNNGDDDLKMDTEFERNEDRYGEELATIEPVIEMNCSDEEVLSSGDGGEIRAHGDQSPDVELNEYDKKVDHADDD